MTIQTKTRFANALALSKSLTVETTKLKTVVDLVIPEESRSTLWKNIKQESDGNNATLTPLHLIIIAFCKSDFHTEFKRDAAYLLCLKQIIGFNENELSILFKWYTMIPKDKFIITG